MVYLFMVTCDIAANFHVYLTGIIVFFFVGWNWLDLPGLQILLKFQSFLFCVECDSGFVLVTLINHALLRWANHCPPKMFAGQIPTPLSDISDISILAGEIL